MKLGHTLSSLKKNNRLVKVTESEKYKVCCIKFFTNIINMILSITTFNIMATSIKGLFVTLSVNDIHLK